jgi:hypothetical protein
MTTPECPESPFRRVKAALPRLLEAGSPLNSVMALAAVARECESDPRMSGGVVAGRLRQCLAAQGVTLEGREAAELVRLADELEALR